MTKRSEGVHVRAFVRLSGALFAATLVASLAVAACRTGDPTGDPKMPSNSPLPSIDKKEDPPASPLPPLAKDAGASRPTPRDPGGPANALARP